MNAIDVKGKRVLVYARVSTNNQRERETIKSQLQVIRTECRGGGAEKVKIHKDDGVSGGSLHRPGIKSLMADVESGEWDMVIIYDVDRLTRRQKHLWTLIEDIENEGVKVHFLNTPVTMDANGKVQISVKGLFAEWERDVILERTSRGKWQKVRSNKFIGHRAMYGYEYIPKSKYPLIDDSKRIKVVPEKMQVVEKLFAWALEGCSTNEILRRVNKLGVPSPKGNAHWSRTSIHNILKNTIYTGVYYYGRSEMYHRKGHDDDTGIKTGRGRRDKSEWVEVRLPKKLRSISQKDYDAVQRQLERNFKNSQRNNKKYEYLLRGLVKCEKCGYAVVGFPSKGRTSYACRNRRLRDGITEKCTLPTIATHRLEPVVWEAVLEEVLKPEVLMAQVKKQIERQREKFKNHDSEIEKARQVKEGLDEEEKRMTKAYREGVTPFELYADEMKEIKKRRSALKVGHTVEPPKEIPKEVLKRSVEKWCEESAKRIKKMTFEDKHKFLHLLIERIQLGTEQVKIQTHIPLSTLCSAGADLRDTIPTIRQPIVKAIPMTPQQIGLKRSYGLPLEK